MDAAPTGIQDLPNELIIEILINADEETRQELCKTNKKINAICRKHKNYIYNELSRKEFKKTSPRSSYLLLKTLKPQLDNINWIRLNPNWRGPNNENILYKAINNSPLSFIKQILALDFININHQENRGRTALMLASSKGEAEVVKMLINFGADINMLDNNGSVALSYAIASITTFASLNTLKVIIDAKADLNIPNGSGVTPLMIAILKSRVSMVKMLIDAGANINLQTKNGDTALMVAVSNDNILQLLIDAKADLNIQDCDGNTVLSLAVRNSHPSAVKMLIDAGANINIQNNLGSTPLSIAATTNDIKSIKLLLNAKADLDIQDNKGNTALLYASQRSINIVRLLIRAGANINLKNNIGESASINMEIINKRL